MTSTQEIDLYNLLAPKLGENEAKITVSTFFNQHKELQQEVVKLQENQKNTASREEVVRIQEQHKELATKADLIKEVGILRTELVKEVSRLEIMIAKLETKLAQVEMRLVRWMAFIAGVIVAADKLIPKAWWVT